MCWLKSLLVQCGTCRFTEDEYNVTWTPWSFGLQSSGRKRCACLRDCRRTVPTAVTTVTKSQETRGKNHRSSPTLTDWAYAAGRFRPPNSGLSRFKTGSIGPNWCVRFSGRKPRLDLSLAQVIACLSTAGGGDLIIGQARPRSRVVGFVQLHVTAHQEAGRNNHLMDTSERGTDTRKFYPEPIGPIRPGAWLRDV